jgi:hypothetical protein
MLKTHHPLKAHKRKTVIYRAYALKKWQQSNTQTFCQTSTTKKTEKHPLNCQSWARAVVGITVSSPRLSRHIEYQILSWNWG